MKSILKFENFSILVVIINELLISLHQHLVLKSDIMEVFFVLSKIIADILFSNSSSPEWFAGWPGKPCSDATIVGTTTKTNFHARCRQRNTN